MCRVDAAEIVASKDPICMFFAEIGKAHKLTTDYREKMQISEKVFTYLLSFDKYIAASLAETVENTPKMFSMIAIIIMHCSQIVYIKVLVESSIQFGKTNLYNFIFQGKNACFFNVVMFQYILPNHLLTGRPQKPQYVAAVHKIWSILMMGIEKLDVKSDKHLQTIVTNLIEKWLPLFKTVGINVFFFWTKNVS